MVPTTPLVRHPPALALLIQITSRPLYAMTDPEHHPPTRIRTRHGRHGGTVVSSNFREPSPPPPASFASSNLRTFFAHRSPQALQSVFGPCGPCRRGRTGARGACNTVSRGAARGRAQGRRTFLHSGESVRPQVTHTCWSVAYALFACGRVRVVSATRRTSREGEREGKGKGGIGTRDPPSCAAIRPCRPRAPAHPHPHPHLHLHY